MRIYETPTWKKDSRYLPEQKLSHPNTVSYIKYKHVLPKKLIHMLSRYICHCIQVRDVQIISRIRKTVCNL